MLALKNAVVTGASSGLGRELTRLLVLERGLTVFATARRQQKLEELRASLPEGKIQILVGDIGEPAFRARLWQQAEEALGGVDLLINSAGIGHYADFAEEDQSFIDRILNVNVVAPFDLTRRAALAMRGRGRGQIVLVSSVLGEFGIPYSATYVASKHAVNGLVKSLRHEFKGTGVRVWAALPGRFASEFRFHALGDRAEPGKPIGGEPVEAVARGILRGLDRDHAFHYPTWTAWATVAASRWCRIPFDWWMGYWGRPHFAREMGRSQT